MRNAASAPPAPRPAASPVTRCVTDDAGFRSLRDDWRRLFARCDRATPFNSWEWLFSWWHAYGEKRALRIVLVERDGVVVGIAPLTLGREATVLRTSCRVLRFVGDGSFDSDHLDFLVDPADEELVMRHVEDWLRSNSEWDALELRELSSTSRSCAALRELASRLDVMVRMEESTSAVLALPRSFDEFLRARQARFRTKLRSLIKRVDQGELVFESEVGPGDLRRKLRSLFALHQRRWNDSGRSGVFDSSAKRRFYGGFAPRFARNAWLRLYSLRRGDDYVAHQLCFGTAGTTYLLQEGFDASNPAASFGQTLRAAVVRHLIESGGATYDFLGGFSRHKEEWGSERGTMVHMTLARRTLNGRLWFNAPLWRERLAAAAKRRLPKPLLGWLRRGRAR